ncbi:MAG TPA: methyltransferase domain-containing protein [Planctomycetota bacterium]|nr:methyltransferase domain-containing protein [Planctomycetota bacterium]
MTSKRDLEAAVRERFANLARRPETESRFPVGRAGATVAGYPADALDALPEGAIASFAGVGNPLALSPPSPGDVVVDVGCGAGLDGLLAARDVGPQGRVTGVDFSKEMIEKARANARLMGVAHAGFIVGAADALPLPSGTADLVVTNGVLNLCVDKPAVVREFFRVLRPGGRLQMADILLEDHAASPALDRPGEWSA